MADNRTPTRNFSDLVEIMTILRKECPWDRKQTHESIKDLMIEEIYEAIEAIDNNDPDELCKELGDLMLHVVFQTEIARESGRFDIGDVIFGIQEKLIRRHPHVFPVDGAAGSVSDGWEVGGSDGTEESSTDGPETGGTSGPDDGGSGVVNADDVKRKWEDLKMRESERSSVLQGVPDTLPALIKAKRMQEKAGAVGFDWETWQRAWPKLQEELEEFREASEQGTEAEKREEFGDLLFSMVNVGRLMGLDAEDALRLTNRKFRNRFQYIEKVLAEKGKRLTDTSLEEMDAIWDEAKRG